MSEPSAAFKPNIASSCCKPLYNDGHCRYRNRYKKRCNSKLECPLRYAPLQARPYLRADKHAGHSIADHIPRDFNIPLPD